MMGSKSIFGLMRNFKNISRTMQHCQCLHNAKWDLHFHVISKFPKIKALEKFPLCSILVSLLWHPPQQLANEAILLHYDIICVSIFLKLPENESPINHLGGPSKLIKLLRISSVSTHITSICIWMLIRLDMFQGGTRLNLDLHD